MPRKKNIPMEEQENNMENLGLPETEATEGTYEFPEGLPEHTEESAEVPPTDAVELPQDGTPPSDAPVIPPENSDGGEPQLEVPAAPVDLPEPPEAAENPKDTEDAPPHRKVLRRVSLTKLTVRPRKLLPRRREMTGRTSTA